MKIRLFCFFCFFCLHLAAQKKMTISGRIVDERLERLPGVNVALYSADSLLLKGEIADEKGEFKLSSVQEGSYVLKFSFIGYVGEEIQLINVAKSVQIDDITLRSETVQLQNVEVVGNQQVRKVDRLFIYPSREQVKISSTSLDLLSEMMLPDLLVNPVERSISSNGQPVELRINGRKVQLSEVEALSPKDILRVEYMDRPGIAYRQEVGAAVNYVTKKDIQGVSVLANLMNATFTGFGNDQLSVKWNHKKTEVGLNYSLSYRKYTKRRTDKDEKYLSPDGSSVSRDWIGENTPFKSQTHRLNLSYSLSDPDRYLFSAIARFESRYLRRQYRASTAAAPALRTSSRDRNHTLLLEIDVYYGRKFSAKHDLNINVVGGYADTDYNRFYQEENAMENYTTTSDIAGYRYTLIGELKYNYHIAKRQLLSAGILENSFWERNTYVVQQKEVKVDNSFTHFYTQLTGGIQRLDYNVGVSTSLNHYSERAADVHFWSFRPSLNLKYKLNASSGLEYVFQTNSFDPDVSYLNNLVESVNAYMVIQGNPDLSPYRNYVNRLFYFWRKKKMNIQLNASHIYAPDPVMDYTYYNDSKSLWVTSYKNQGSVQRAYGSVHVKYGPFLRDMVTLMAIGEYVHFRSKGDDYLHTLDNLSFKFQAQFVYKNFSLSAMANTRSKSLWGEKLTYNELFSSLLLQYTQRNYIVGLGMYYPFSKNWEAGNKTLSAVAPSRSWTSIQNNGHMVYVKFSWNFSSGKKYKGGQKVLNNRGASSGFLTAPGD